MSHIVCAIGYEAARVRDDWETALLCAEAAERAGDEPAPRPPAPHALDNYCFEMLALVSVRVSKWLQAVCVHPPVQEPNTPS